MTHVTGLVTGQRQKIEDIRWGKDLAGSGYIETPYGQVPRSQVEAMKAKHAKLFVRTLAEAQASGKDETYIEQQWASAMALGALSENMRIRELDEIRQDAPPGALKTITAMMWDVKYTAADAAQLVVLHGRGGFA